MRAKLKILFAITKNWLNKMSSYKVGQMLTDYEAVGVIVSIDDRFSKTYEVKWVGERTTLFYDGNKESSIHVFVSKWRKLWMEVHGKKNNKT